jgi:hypothetical protein
VVGRTVVGIELVEVEEVGRGRGLGEDGAGEWVIGPQRFGVATEGDGVGELRTTSASEAGPVGMAMPLGVVVPEALVTRFLSFFLMGLTALRLGKASVSSTDGICGVLGRLSLWLLLFL